MTGTPSKSTGGQRPATSASAWSAGHGGAERLAEDDTRLELRGVERGPCEAEVELAPSDAVGLGGGDALVEDHLDAGQAAVEILEEGAEHADGRHRGEPEPEGPGGAAVDPSGQVAGAVDEGEEPVGLVEEGAPRLGQLDLAVVSLEERHAHGALELLDLAAERWLRHGEPLGRAAEVQLLGDGDEGADLVEGHHVRRGYRTIRRRYQLMQYRVWTRITSLRSLGPHGDRPHTPRAPTSVPQLVGDLQ